MILQNVFYLFCQRERQIIQCTFIEGLSQKETGEELVLVKCMFRLQRTAIKITRSCKTVNELLTDFGN